MRCDFCGYTFNPEAAEIACASCPLAGNCHLIRCPRCGYEMPPEAKLIGWLRRVWSKRTTSDQVSANPPLDVQNRPDSWTQVKRMANGNLRKT